MVKKSSKKTEKNEEQKLNDNIQNEIPDEQDLTVTETEEEAIAREEQEKAKAGQDFLLKIAELQDKYIRLSAEFDNYRKRTLKERVDLMKSAGGDIIVKLLPVMDDFERALSSMGEAKDIEAVKAGV
jgi:molecular chaperone GrpE